MIKKRERERGRKKVFNQLIFLERKINSLPENENYYYFVLILKYVLLYLLKKKKSNKEKKYIYLMLH